MWSYYGSKKKIAGLYPAPKRGLVIEPFAGAAWYSILHRSRKVLLNEKYPVLYEIWNWLIKEASSDLLLENKDFFMGQDISQINLKKPHRDLIGFCINRGSTAPKNIVQKWSCQAKSDKNWASTTAFSIERIAKLLPEIRHWETKFGDYKDLPDVEATWFIDPPYQFGGEHYLVNDINYSELSEWCKTRKGHVIVCENSKANWLPFEPFTAIQGQRSKTDEVVWVRETKSRT